MIAHPTHVLRTTRFWSRSAIARLNQSCDVHKGEPKRRKAGLEPRPPRIVEPGAKSADTRAAVTDASLLLVILHYLLKNNTPFMGGYGAGQHALGTTFCHLFLPGGIAR